MTPRNLATMSGREVREACRAGLLDGPTAGAALGYVQANLVVLPAGVAQDFEQFCRRNPQPCPLLEMTGAGQYEPTVLAAGADLRTDLPRYRVFRRGRCVATPTDIISDWRDDFIAFLIGCSFSFEYALMQAGVPIRHIEEGRNVPMYRTNVACIPAGVFHGPLVVSMRPMRPDEAAEAKRITAAMPDVHGQPLQVGDPAALGIGDIHSPDYGDAVSINAGEIPVFWACGVTPLEAIIRAKPEIAITHEPGHMFVTDARIQDGIEQ